MSRENCLEGASADAIISKPEDLERKSNENHGKKSNKRATTLLRRIPSFQSALRPNFRRFRRSFSNLSCVKKEDEEMPMLDVPRHKSIDINVGLARRFSMFLFTRRTVCVHPYHPYTPEQTTRKIHFGICLIEAESSRRTEVVGGPDDDGSFDYGLFQINDRYWCNAGDIPGKGCNVTCSEILTDNITIASQCAQSIYEKQGFSAWLGWRNECMDMEQKQIDC